MLLGDRKKEHDMCGVYNAHEEMRNACKILV